MEIVIFLIRIVVDILASEVVIEELLIGANFQVAVHNRPRKRTEWGPAGSVEKTVLQEPRIQKFDNLYQISLVAKTIKSNDTMSRLFENEVLSIQINSNIFWKVEHPRHPDAIFHTPNKIIKVVLLFIIWNENI